eukprot:3378543-Rhodomonas_salina.1
MSFGPSVPIPLRPPYAMAGTNTWRMLYGLRFLIPLKTTAPCPVLTYAADVDLLQRPYAMSGTDVAYGAARRVAPVQARPLAFAYAPTPILRVAHSPLRTDSALSSYPLPTRSP